MAERSGGLSVWQNVLVGYLCGRTFWWVICMAERSGGLSVWQNVLVGYLCGKKFGNWRRLSGTTASNAILNLLLAN